MLGCKWERFAVDFSQKSLKIFAGKGPLEGRCTAFVVGLEGEESLLEFGQRREVVRGKDFSLNDGEVDLDLVEPTGVDRGVDKNGVGPYGAEMIGGFLPTMSGTIVHNPEDPMGSFVGRLAHHLINEPIHRSNAVLYFAAAEDLGAMHVPRCQVGPSAFAKVLVLDSHGASGSRWQSRLFAAAGLNASLFIRRDHKVVDAQRDVLPNALVQVKDATGLCRKVGITREKPASMLPGAQRIAAEPAPQGRAADLRDQPLSNNMLAEVGDREPGQRQSEVVWQLAGERLN